MLLRGLDVLLAGLVCVAVAVGAQAAPASHAGLGAWPLAVAGGVLLAVYLIGRASISTLAAGLDAPRGRLWPEGAWVAALIVCWVALLWWSPSALWIAFPLMLLQMHALGPRRGVVAVALTTGFAIAHGLRTGWSGVESLGGILGPVVGAGVAIAVVLGLEAIARESAERQRVVDELGRAREHLAELDRERAVLGERGRLAREIHDTLAQGLAGIELLLRAARPHLDDSPAAELVDRAAETARENLTEARRFVRALAPADLAEHSLAAALLRQVERVREHGVDADLRVAGTASSLSLATEAALLRIAQSALANVVQHADATRVDVGLTFADDEVRLDIVDDGVGFDPDAASVGFGLPGMASRVRELGGRFAVESSAGDGTAVAVVLPVEQEGGR